MTQTQTRQCTCLIERSGYFTGIRCSRDATFLVNDKAMCTQHKNKAVKNGWYKPPTVTPVAS